MILPYFFIPYTVFLAGVLAIIGLLYFRNTFNVKGIGFLVTGIILFILVSLSEDENSRNLVSESKSDIAKLDKMSCTQLKEWKQNVTTHPEIDVNYYVKIHAIQLLGACT
jgi:hypothetical protein